MEAGYITKIFRKSVVIVALLLMTIVFAMACTGNEDMELPKITGVSAFDVDVRYNGLKHGIRVDNVLETDEVSYSVYSSGPWVADNIEYTEPGEYTVFYRVVRDGYKEFISSAHISIARGIISGISAADVTYVYDGRSHGIEIVGLRETDTVEYSIDGKEFKSTLEITEIGEYIVYYRVKNADSDFADSCMVTVLPDINGRYLNAVNGVILLNGGSAAVNGETLALNYDVSGIGTIGGKEFSVKDGVLNFCGDEYSLVAEEDKIYVVTVNGNAFYTSGGATAALKIEFADNNAEVSVDGTRLTSVADRNYCESINVDVERSYFTSDIFVVIDGNVEIELSERATQSVTVSDTQIVFDGKAHGIELEYDGNVVLTEEEHEFSSIGRYEISVVLIKDGCLPLIAKAVLEIIPDLSGIYYRSDEFVSIDKNRAELNGVRADCEYINGRWEIEGAPVTATEDGITVGDKEFTRLEKKKSLAFIVFGTETFVVADADNLIIAVNDGVAEMSHGGVTVFSRAVGAGGITVNVNDKALPDISDGETRLFIIGIDELRPDSVTNIVIACKIDG